MALHRIRITDPMMRDASFVSATGGERIAEAGLYSREDAERVAEDLRKINRPARTFTIERADAKTRGAGAFGWRKVPSPHFPGESTLACPTCDSLDVSMFGIPGYDGRMGSPGEGSGIECRGCGARDVDLTPRAYR